MASRASSLIVRMCERRDTALRYGAALFVLAATVTGPGVSPLRAQDEGVVRGEVQASTDQMQRQLSVQARDIQTGTIAATSDVDPDTAGYELASLPPGSYHLELVGHDGEVLCSEGPVEITSHQIVHQADTLSCGGHAPWWLPLLAAAAGGGSTGVVLGQGQSSGSGSAPTTVCHDGGTITVDGESLPGHLSHGDTLGPCPTSPTR